MNNELSDAVYDRLTDAGTDEGAALAGLLADYQGTPAVFANQTVPDDAERMWVQIGPVLIAEPFDTKDRDGIDASIDIGIYADNAGDDSDVNTAAKMVQRLLHRHRLAVSGYSVLVAEARKPVLAPTDETVVGRVVSARWLLRSWEQR